MLGPAEGMRSAFEITGRVRSFANCTQHCLATFVTSQTSERPRQAPDIAEPMPNSSSVAPLLTLRDRCWDNASPYPDCPYQIVYRQRTVVAGLTWHVLLPRTGLCPERAARQTCLWESSSQQDTPGELWSRLLGYWTAGSNAVNQVVRSCPGIGALALRSELVRLLFATFST